MYYAPAVLFHMTEVCAIYFLGLPVVWGATAKVCMLVAVLQPGGTARQFETRVPSSPITLSDQAAVCRHACLHKTNRENVAWGMSWWCRR